MEDESHGSTQEVPDELRERATPMAVDARQDPTTRSGAIPRIVTLGRQVGELLRANEILKTSAAFFAAEHWDGSPLGESKS
jgi:transposase